MTSAIPDVVRESSEQTFVRKLAEIDHVECGEGDTGAVKWYDLVRKIEGNCAIEWHFERWSRSA